MKLATVVLLCLTVSIAFGQHIQGTSGPLTVVSTSPANGAVNVASGTTTLSITFSDPVDTSSFALGNNGTSMGILMNADTATGVAFSVDHKTVIYSVRFTAGKPYFVCLYYAKSAAAVYLAAPYTFYFTTGASFPTTTVSGSVSSGSSGVPTAGAFVALSTTTLSEGNPSFTAGTIADANGHFTIPYVPNGTVYPIAAKDVNGDGNIDPSTGDAVGQGTSITVNGANVTGVVITFQSVLPFTYKDAVDSLNAHAAQFLTPHTLRQVQASSLDSTGKASYWEFDYTGADWQHSFMFRLQTFGSRVSAMDSMTYSWVVQMNPIATLPAAGTVSSFLAAAESGGGNDYRPVPMNWNGFDVRLNIGQLSMSGFQDMVSDQSKLYLGLTYWYGTENQHQSTILGQRRFLGDYNTGSILGITGINTPGNTHLPATYALGQNYPNPFNPATNVEFSLPATSLVHLRVFNLLGQEVATIVNGTLAAGDHTVRFDGAGLASGVYLYRLDTGNFVKTMKMVMLK